MTRPPGPAETSSPPAGPRRPRSGRMGGRRARLAVMEAAVAPANDEISITAATSDRSEVARRVLEALPDWFGIPSAREGYIRDVAEHPMVVARTKDGVAVGFLSLRRTSTVAVEAFVLGVLPDRHRSGIGRRLFAAAERMVRPDGVRFLTVKTLAAGHPDPNYAATRRFYEANGFVLLEEFPTLWSADTPCALYIKDLCTASSRDAGPERTEIQEQRPGNMPPDPALVERTLVIACGALARELIAVIEANGWTQMDVTGVPAKLHNRPEQIPAAVRTKIRAARRKGFGRVLCLYGDCGTGGLLDAMLAEEGVERIDGAHCYAFYTGLEAFDALNDPEPGTFYLTDYLARHFDSLVWKGLGLDRFPHLMSAYFGNYTRLVYLAQIPSPDTEARARRAAEKLGLKFEMRTTGLTGLDAFLKPRA